MPRFSPKDYEVPVSPQEATKLLQEQGSRARILAGGATFYELSKREMMPEVEVIVDLSELKLDSIKVEADTLRIGSMVTLTDLLNAPVIREHSLQALSDLLVKFTPLQIRNVATIGGELCAGVPFLELPAIAIALNATLTIVGPKGNRPLPADKFFLDYFLVDLRRGEYLQDVVIPIRKGTAASAYVGQKRASVNTAVSLSLDRAGNCERISIGLGGMGPVPLRASSVESALLGKKIDSQTVWTAAAGIDQLNPLGSVHASPWYKKEVCKVFVRDAIQMARRRLAGEGDPDN